MVSCENRPTVLYVFAVLTMTTWSRSGPPQTALGKKKKQKENHFKFKLCHFHIQYICVTDAIKYANVMFSLFLSICSKMNSLCIDLVFHWARSWLEVVRMLSCLLGIAATFKFFATDEGRVKSISHCIICFWLFWLTEAPSSLAALGAEMYQHFFSLSSSCSDTHYFWLPCTCRACEAWRLAVTASNCKLSPPVQMQNGAHSPITYSSNN